MIEGDFTRLLSHTPAEQMDAVREMLNFPYDLSYEPLPVLKTLDVPQLWILAGDDTEAPHQDTLTILNGLKENGRPITTKVFPDSDHGMIALKRGPEGLQLAGRTAPGYFELLFEWISARTAMTP